MNVEYKKFEVEDLATYTLQLAYYIIVYGGVFCLILCCALFCLFFLVMAIVGIVFVAISPSFSGRVELIKNYNQIASQWQSTHFVNFIPFKFEAEISGVSKSIPSFSPADNLNDSPKNGETFPSYTHYALKNSNISYFTNETFQTNQFVSLDLFFNTNVIPRRKFGNTISIEKFKTTMVTMEQKQCLDQGGSPSGTGMCSFNLILDSACIEVDLVKESHISCPGYTYGKYSILKSTQGKFTVTSDLLIREKNDPFSWVYRTTNGSLSFGSSGFLEFLITGIVFIVVGTTIVFLFLLTLCVIVVAAVGCLSFMITMLQGH
jgi:hypothetical protein